MTEKQTRLVLLRLQSPRLHIFCGALEQKILDGWQIQVPARQGGTMFTVTLVKEVPIDSELPTKAVWNCNPQFEPQVLEEYNIAQNEVQELPEAPYPPVDTLELIPNNTSVVIDANNISAAYIIATTETVLPIVEKVEVAKSASGFEIKEYSLEEVQKLSWGKLTQLNMDLGLQKGKKPDMEKNIVEASKAQWGNA